MLKSPVNKIDHNPNRVGKKYPASRCLECLEMDNPGAGNIVLCLCDPHLCRCAERCPDRPADPYRVLALRRRSDGNGHRIWNQSFELLLHPGIDTRVHSCTARQHDVLVQVLADIDISLHNRVERCQVHARKSLAERLRVEQSFRAAEAFLADCDDIAIGKLVRLLQVLIGLGHLRLKVKRHISEFLLDVSHNFLLGICGETVATLCQQLDHVFSQVPASEVQADYGMGQCEPLIDGHCVCHTVTRVQHHACGPA